MMTRPPRPLPDIMKDAPSDGGRFSLTHYDLNRGDWNMNAWLALFRVIFHKIFGREFDDHYRTLIPELILYFSGNESKLFPSDKGIYISGFVGTGKTVIMDTIQELTRAAFNKNYFKTLECGSIALIKNEEDFISAVEYKKPALYDDLGSESISVKVYGTEILPMAEVIMARYRLFQLKGVPSFFTSNFPIEALEERYGSRVSSRLSEMCSSIHLNTKDMRLEKIKQSRVKEREGE